jgi:N utilization substance protein A
MSKIVIDSATLQCMSFFEKSTGAHIKDCVVAPELVTFIVLPGEMGKAIGKSGANIRRVESVLKRKVRVVEFADDLAAFIKNMASPLEVANVIIEGNIATIEAADYKTRGLLIGRAAQNLRSMEAIVKRYFPVEEIKVA